MEILFLLIYNITNVEYLITSIQLLFYKNCYRIFSFYYFIIISPKKLFKKYTMMSDSTRES